MTRKTHLLRCAGSAIAAALVLGSTPVLAQDVVAPNVTAPAVTAPPAAPVPVPAPAVADPVMVSTPVVQDTPTQIVPPELPSVTPNEEPAAEAVPVAVRQTTTVARRAVAAEPQAVVPAAPVPQSETVIEPVPPVALPNEPAATVDAAEPASEAPYGLLAGLLAALGIVGLAGWGFVAIGRRRKFAEKPAPVVERPVVAKPVPQPGPAMPIMGVTPLASPRPVVPTPEPSMSHTGAAVALPRELPTTFAERDALLRRMIDAKPDRANPFRSPKARARRARLIIQSLGRDFGDADPRIDLSQYPSNWPSVARRKFAAA